MNASEQSRTLYSIDITVTLNAPWLVHGSEPGRYGLDTTLLRNHEGLTILPGSLIVGRIRTAWQEMQENFGLEMPDGAYWFGSKGINHNQYARIWVNDLIAPKKDEALMHATRITIDAETAAVKSGNLLIMEQTHSAAETVDFKGQWRVYLAASEIKELTNHLRAGLRWHSQLGAQRGIGFGELLAVTIELNPLEKLDKKNQTSTIKNVLQKRLIIKMDRPICVAAQSRRGNVFESSDIVSGGTLKGAIARLICARHGKDSLAECSEASKLAKHFDYLRITHALPSNTKKRPCAIPLSLVSSRNKVILDIAKEKEAKLIDGKTPAFQHDWKSEWSTVDADRGWGKTSTYLRVRTAIDETKRIAKEGDLFAYQCKVPEEETVWITDIHLAGIAESERDAVLTELEEITADGIGPIGKTDAWGAVEFSDIKDEVWPQQPLADEDDNVIIMLNTPTLLLASSQLDGQQPDLYLLYSNIFNELADKTLTLTHFYANHQMAGGEFIWKRYLRPQKKSDNYLPLVLTDAGSVFVLKINREQEKSAWDKIRCWQQQGLDLPKKVVSEHGKYWYENPYIPQNGFGEITVNVAHNYHKLTANQLTACK